MPYGWFNASKEPLSDFKEPSVIVKEPLSDFKEPLVIVKEALSDFKEA